MIDPQQHSYVLSPASGGQPGPALYRPGCSCGGWIYGHLVRTDSPRAQAAFVSWADEHFLLLHQE